MSIHMDNAKKKAQDEMKRLMLQRKNKDKNTSKINNPLAKYNNIGQLTCILCSSIVRSESVWQVHINSKQHRENIEKAKKLKEMTNNFTEGKIKRSGPPITDAPQEKKPKSILKNANKSVPIVKNKPKNNAPNVYSFHEDEVKRKDINTLINKEDNKREITEDSQVNSNTSQDEQDQKVQEANVQPIPEGFFDDPILDAKARNIEYKDPIEEEWEKFQKEIKNETSTSAEIIAGEQEEATAERQIDEIDEQIRNWSRVLDLELKKEETKKKIQDIEMLSENDDNDSDNETDLDEFLDWRAKKSYT